MSETLREISKGERLPVNGTVTYEALQVGSLQRIADAVETMGASYRAIISDRDYYKRAYEESCERVGHLSKTISALRGVITRMKK